MAIFQWILVGSIVQGTNKEFDLHHIWLNSKTFSICATSFRLASLGGLSHLLKRIRLVCTSRLCTVLASLLFQLHCKGQKPTTPIGSICNNIYFHFAIFEVRFTYKIHYTLIIFSWRQDFFNWFNLEGQVVFSKKGTYIPIVHAF